MLHLIFLLPWLCFYYFSLCSSCLDFLGYEAVMGSEAMGWRDSEGFGLLESVYPVEATKGLVDQCLSIWTESGLQRGYHYCQWTVWQRMAGWLKGKLEEKEEGLLISVWLCRRGKLSDGWRKRWAESEGKWTWERNGACKIVLERRRRQAAGGEAPLPSPERQATIEAPLEDIFTCFLSCSASMIFFLYCGYILAFGSYSMHGLWVRERVWV